MKNEFEFKSVKISRQLLAEQLFSIVKINSIILSTILKLSINVVNKNIVNNKCVNEKKTCLLFSYPRGSIKRITIPLTLKKLLISYATRLYRYKFFTIFT